MRERGRTAEDRLREDPDITAVKVLDNGDLEISFKVTQKVKDAFGFLKEKEGDDLIEFLIQERIKEKTEEVAAKGFTLEEWLEKQVRERETRVTPKPPSIPHSPDPFAMNEGKAPNNPVTYFLLSALADGGPLARYKWGGWHENPHSGGPQYIKQHKGSKWCASIDPTNYPDMTLGDAEMQWATVERLSPMHMQAALFLLSKLGDTRNNVAHPMLEAVTITSDEFLRIKSITRKGHSRQIIQRDIAQCMHDLAGMRADVRNVKIWMDGEHRRANLANCGLFDITEVYEEQIRTDGLVDKLSVGWAVRAGVWAQYYLSQEGRYWVSAIARCLLELDHRSNRRPDTIALKIGILCFTIAGGTHFRNGPVEKTVRELLKSLGELPIEERRGAHWANRTDAALSEALARLVDLGVLVTYGFGPTYPDPNDRGRGWVDRWLSAKVSMTGAEAAAMTQAAKQQALANARRSTKARRNRGAGRPRKQMEEGQYLNHETTAGIVAKYKGRLFWNQETLAKHVGISRSHLSNVLNRREPASKGLAVKLRDFLNNYPEPE